jgi:YD repeat-containing protein
VTGPSANYCWVYNYYGVANPTSCAVPTAGTSGNNGNVTGYYYLDNTNPYTHTDVLTYDTLNRLTSSVATGSATHNLTFSYDRYGNMACQTNGSTNGPCPNWTFSASTNRITTSGFTYDAAGNTTGDGVNTYT